MPRKGFRPTPSHLRGLRRGARERWYARFYGLYETYTGKRKRFSFQIRVSPRLRGRRLSRLIRAVVNSLKDNDLPEHRQGEVFSSFSVLFERTPWVKVRRLVRYEAGVIYER